jgi:hypothetical protein
MLSYWIVDLVNSRNREVEIRLAEFKELDASMRLGKSIK